MRTINTNNPDQKSRFIKEVAGFTDSGIPYRLDELTSKGGNFTLLIPLKWKEKINLPSLRIELQAEHDVDKIKIEYINFIKK